LNSHAPTPNDINLGRGVAFVEDRLSRFDVPQRWHIWSDEKTEIKGFF
jgi:hypothetical protein